MQQLQRQCGMQPRLSCHGRGAPFTARGAPPPRPTRSLVLVTSSFSSSSSSSSPASYASAVPANGAQPEQPPAPSSGAAPLDASGAVQQQQQQQEQEQPKGFFGKVKSLVLGRSGKLDKQRLAELGLGAFCAYGVISNINASVLVTLAWLTIVKTQGCTPLAPDMWPKFLAVYAGLWVSSHFMRPIRLSLAIAAAPTFDAALNFIMSKTKCSKTTAFAIVLVCIFFGSLSFLGLMLLLFGGLPGGLAGLRAPPPAAAVA